MNSTGSQSGSSYLKAEEVHDMHPRQQNKKHSIFLAIAILLAIVGIAVWVLNIVGIIAGPWSSIFGAFFTVLGAILALLQLLPRSFREAPVRLADSSITTQQQKDHPIQLEGVILCADEQHGALVVYVKRYLRGSTINLSRGYNSVDLRIDGASSVVGRKKRGREVFVGVFPALESGIYTVYSESREFMAKTSIHAGQVTEMDWQ